jgi:plastocyanin
MILRRARLVGFCSIIFLYHFCHATPLTVSGRVVIQRAQESAGRQSRFDNSKVVVWLTPIAPLQDPMRQTAAPQRLIQKNKSFVPGLLVVPVGSSIEFPNQDPFFHNVFSLFSGRRFDLGLYEAGSSRAVKFDREGVSYIFCNIHPEMHAVVIALGTPLFAVSDATGAFRIPDVPAGRYVMHVWYERAAPAMLHSLDQEVTISAQRTELPLVQVNEAPELSAEHKNKFGKDYDRTPATTLY